MKTQTLDLHVLASGFSSGKKTMLVQSFHLVPRAEPR